MKKVFRILFLLLLVIAAGFRCSQNSASAGQNLIYWSSNNTYEIEFARRVVKEWNRLHPEFPVHHQPVPEGQSSEEVILAAVVGKTTPDIYSNMWQGDVEAFARAGVLIPLDTIPGFLSAIYDRCDSAVVAEATSSDGHIFQIPWKTNPIMMIYNVKLLEEIGFTEPPANYSEFLEAARRFQKDTDGDGYVDRWIGNIEVLVTWWQRLFDFYPLYLAASGGAPLIENDSVRFHNVYAVRTFEFLRTLFDNRYLPRERLSARQDAFLSGVIATRFTGPWEIQHAENFKPEGFEYAFAPLPVPDDHEGPVYTYGDPKNIVVFNTCKHPDMAWKFIEFMISRENDLRFLEITSQLPRRRHLFEDPFFAGYFRQHPRMIPFALQADYVRGADACEFLKEIFDAISQEFEASVVYGIKNPKKAIEDAARRARLIL